MSVIHIRTPGDAFTWAVRSTFQADALVSHEASSFWLVPGTFDEEGNSLL